ncbi:hypothetical protein ACOSQ3_004661 [Xanthoceras sorbifolium]
MRHKSDAFHMFKAFKAEIHRSRRICQESPGHMKVMVKFIKFHSTYGGEDNVFIFLGKYQSHGYVI